MKNKTLTILSLLLALLALPACSHKKQMPQLETVHACRHHHYDMGNSTGGWIYWYWFQDSYTRQFYYFTSPTPVSGAGFESGKWVATKELPPEAEQAVNGLPDEEVATEQLGQVATELEHGYGSIPEENSLDSMEGVPETSVEAPESSVSESSSSDSGGDSGGGE